MEQEMEPKHTAGFMTIIPQSLKKENSLPEEKHLFLSRPISHHLYTGNYISDYMDLRETNHTIEDTGRIVSWFRPIISFVERRQL